jgi:hypothetical protein
MTLRQDVNAKAARLLDRFIRDQGLSRSEFAEGAEVKESSLNYFLHNDSESVSARRHTRGPYRETLAPILELDLPEELREALLDAIHFKERVAFPKLARGSAQVCSHKIPTLPASFELPLKAGCERRPQDGRRNATQEFNACTTLDAHPWRRPSP